jgi:Zn-dependent M28 family amino/carboxypeptidase
VALARNVVATWPGTDPTGTVVLAAHYDTVAGSPGAADDGIGMGTVLEVARALSTGGAAPLRNDVVVLLTDAEEPGLLGADAFARERAGALGETVVLNHEARGAAGAPTTFRTTSPNGVLLEALSRAPGASADSASEAAFEALPNGSDFTPLTGAGLHALDTAIAAGSAHYHSPVDDLAHLSPASLQQMATPASPWPATSPQRTWRRSTAGASRWSRPCRGVCCGTRRRRRHRWPSRRSPVPSRWWRCAGAGEH